jgi:TonB-linked SusC/RagA family outer membrane protein
MKSKSFTKRSLWYVMKITAIVMLITTITGTLALSENTYGQKALDHKISISAKDVSLTDALDQISSQADLKFMYMSKTLHKIKHVSIVSKNVMVKHILTNLLTPNNLMYEAHGDYVIIKNAKPHPESTKTVAEPEKTPAVSSINNISGTVKDEKGGVLPGVSVVLKGTTRGTTTDTEGRFQIDVADDHAVLVFSFVGYQTYEVNLSKQTNLNIQLQPDQSQLQEVIVVGYGTKRRENVTGAVAQVSGSALTSRPITKLGQALQGLIPNLNITNLDGNPNSDPDLNIRGTTSLSGGGPLVLVDGIQMDMNILNPIDIESITVLKDAASAAIYGARGAFGVILVTTKKGSKDQKTRISYSGAMQFNKPTYLPDLLNPVDYIESQNIASVNANGSQKYSDQQVQWLKDYIRDPVNNPNYHTLPNGNIFWHNGNDVFKMMLQPWAPGHNHTLSINGGNAKTSYYLSGGFLKQDGMFKTNTDEFKRYNFTSNLTTDVNDWLKIGVKANYVSTGYDEPHRYTNKGSSWWEQMTRGEPQILYPAKTPAGSPVGEGVATENFVNFLESGSRNITNRSTGIFGTNAEIDIISGLKLKGDFSYTAMRQNRKDDQRAFPYIRETWITQISGTSPSLIQRDFDQSDYFAGNIYADYSTVIAQKHSFSALVGYNQEWQNNLSTSIKRQDLITNEVPVLNLATGTSTSSDIESAWAIRGIFARLNYDFMGKYLLEFNSRYDGTSRFPAGRRFGYFPSISAGWRISKEKFMSALTPVLHDFKLRGSYGSLGNQNVKGNYPYISLFSINQQVPYSINGALPLGIAAPGLVSPDLTWEKVSTLDIGADANLWGKLDLGFDWYKRTTAGMLVAGDKLPAVLGTSVPQRNAAELETRGFELSMKWHDVLPNKLRYDLGVVLSDYEAVITKFDNNPNKLITNYYVGQNLNEIWGFETVGLFQNKAEVTSAANQDQIGNGGKWGAGDVQYKDLNGDNVINKGALTVSNPGDRKIIGNSTPRYQFGVTGNVYWKNFDFNVLFQGIGKRDASPAGSYFWGAINNGAAVGTNEVYHNAWTAENPDAYYPIYKAGSTYNIETQTRFLQNAAYIRLKNISLGYQVPVQVLQKIRLTQARVYVTGQNMWEHTKLKGNFDPEITSAELGVFYPLQRVVSFGVQLSL